MIEIELTQGKAAIVDDIDSDLDNFKWYVNNGYAVRSKGKRPNRKKQYIHRVILERILGRSLTTNEQVDHINMNRLDNRRENLRLATKAENNRNRCAQVNNTSGFKGVNYCKDIGKYRAYIKLNGKQKHLGYFNTPELAYEAYKQAVDKYHGDFGNYG